jgi:hypothetical protein
MMDMAIHGGASFNKVIDVLVKKNIITTHTLLSSYKIYKIKNNAR